MPNPITYTALDIIQQAMVEIGMLAPAKFPAATKRSGLSSNSTT